MRKETYVYNRQSLRYEKVVVPWNLRLFKGFTYLGAIALMAFLFFIISYRFFPSPKEEALMREITQMKDHYASVNKQVDEMSKVLFNVQERDASVHRLMLGMEPIDREIWNGGVGGHNKYEYLTMYRNTGALLVSTQEKLDKLARKIVVQSKSLDEILNLAKDKEKMFASIPAIKPIRSDKIKRNIRSLSGFGMRLHPIWKKRRMHTGIDFTSPHGTSVRVTGAGKVKKIIRAKTGYGLHIIVDHGYGYQTLYAHLDEVSVEVGQEVPRGEKIGKVGSSGTSTAPHLHYEVIFNGRKIDPIHFCMDGLSPKEYKQLVESASIVNQSMD